MPAFTTPVHEHGDKGEPNYPHTGSASARTVDADGVTHVGDFVELYHGTSQRRAHTIAKQGLKLRAVKEPTMGGDPPSSRNYIWFAKKSEAAANYARMHRGAVVVTVRIPQALYTKINQYGRNSGPVSVWSPEAIPAKYVHSVRKVD